MKLCVVHADEVNEIAHYFASSVVGLAYKTMMYARRGVLR
jgi:hypothetical protein